MTARRRAAGRRSARRAPRRKTDSTVSMIILCGIVGLFLLSIAWQFRREPKPEIQRPETPIKVLVLNGVGKSGLAAVFSEKLRRVAQGAVDVLGAENAPVMDHQHTVVIEHGNTRQRADYVAHLVGCDSTAIGPATKPGIDVTVILGYDFEHLFPGRDRWWETP